MRAFVLYADHVCAKIFRGCFRASLNLVGYYVSFGRFLRKWASLRAIRDAREGNGLHGDDYARMLASHPPLH